VLKIPPYTAKSELFTPNSVREGIRQEALGLYNCTSPTFRPTGCRRKSKMWGISSY